MTIAGRTFELDISFLDELEMAQPVSALASFSGATLFMHAPLDDVVGLQNAEILYRAARHPKSFISLDDADHLLTREEDSTYAATVIAAWAGRYLPAGQTQSTRAQTFEAGAGTTAINRGGWPTALESRGFRFMSDQPRTKGGTEAGPTPYDFVSMALAACTAMTLSAYADRKKWDIGDVDVTVTHHREHAEDCNKNDHPSGYMDRMDIDLRFSPHVTDEQRTALVRIAGRCPVHLTLTEPVEIHAKTGDVMSGSGRQ